MVFAFKIARFTSIIMNPHRPKENTMFNIDNPFGTDLFVAPAPDSVKVKPHKLPKTKKGSRVLRAPKPPSAVIKNVLLTW
jgi:hypothetical protein